MLCVSGSRREYDLSYLSENDLSSLGLKVRWLDLWLRECLADWLYTNLPDMGTEVVVAVTKEVGFDNRNKH